jgi:hypothetical protein
LCAHSHRAVKDKKLIEKKRGVILFEKTVVSKFEFVSAGWRGNFAIIAAKQGSGGR